MATSSLVCADEILVDGMANARSWFNFSLMVIQMASVSEWVRY